MQRPLSINGENIGPEPIIRDLGVWVDNGLKFSPHIEIIVAKAYQRQNLIFRAFSSRNQSFLKQLFLTYVRPLLEFNTAVWSPSAIGDVKRLESVQRAFSRRVPGLAHYSYFERLNLLGLQSLELRRLHFDLCEVFKIVSNLSILKIDDFFSLPTDGRTRGHSKRFSVPPWRLQARKNSFAVRVVPIWNSLAEAVVTSGTLKTFARKIKDVDFSVFLKLNDQSF